MSTDPEDRRVVTRRKIPIDLPKFLPQEFLERQVALTPSRALLYRPNHNNEQRGKVHRNSSIITLCVLFVTSLVVGNFLNDSESKQIKFDSCSREYKHLEAKNNQLRVSVRKLVQKVERNEEIMKSFLTYRNKTIEHFINNSIKSILESVDKMIEIYDADTIGLVDYALESNGGQVLSTPATTPYSPFNVEGLLGFLRTHAPPSNPQTLLQPSHFPGDCFAFAGSRGRIRIQLATAVAITAVTVEHVDRRLVLDRSSAPKHFEILGLSLNDSDKGEKLGEFEYNLDRKRVQTFEVFESPDRNKPYELLELRVLTNYGNPEFTCVYRFRVHGKVV